MSIWSPHGFLSGKAMTDMWDILELPYMIDNHIAYNQKMVSDFSSWTQGWETALDFSSYLAGFRLASASEEKDNDIDLGGSEDRDHPHSQPPHTAAAAAARSSASHVGLGVHHFDSLT